MPAIRLPLPQLILAAAAQTAADDPHYSAALSVEKLQAARAAGLAPVGAPA